MIIITVKLFQDSQAAFLALSCLGVDKTCSLEWVSGHCGIEGNESADLKADLGRAKEFTGHIPSLLVLYTFIKCEIYKNYYIDEFNDRWMIILGYRKTKLFLSSQPSSLGKADL